MIDRYKDPNIIQDIERLPIHLRKQISRSLLAKYPQYKDLFHKCGGCGKLSLKPKMNPNLYTPQSVKNCKERKCNICDYEHVEQEKQEKESKLFD